jgi:hypothetical protein
MLLLPLLPPLLPLLLPLLRLSCSTREALCEDKYTHKQNQNCVIQF